MIKYTVWEWLGVSKEDFEKISGKDKCVKCGKPTRYSHNLCHGHHIAYHRWVNKKVKEDKESAKEKNS